VLTKRNAASGNEIGKLANYRLIKRTYTAERCEMTELWGTRGRVCNSARYFYGSVFGL